jgi:hypothetical protein
MGVKGTRVLFTAAGFPHGGSGRQTCAKIGNRQLYTEGEAIHKTEHKTIQKHRIHKIENKITSIKEKQT